MARLLIIVILTGALLTLADVRTADAGEFSPTLDILQLSPPDPGVTAGRTSREDG